MCFETWMADKCPQINQKLVYSAANAHRFMKRVTVASKKIFFNFSLLQSINQQWLTISCTKFPKNKAMHIIWNSIPEVWRKYSWADRHMVFISQRESVETGVDEGWGWIIYHWGGFCTDIGECLQTPGYWWWLFHTRRFHPVTHCYVA